MHKVYSEKIHDSSDENLKQIESLLYEEKYDDAKSNILKLSNIEIIDMILNIDFDLLANFVLLIENRLEPHMIPNIDNERTNLIYKTLGPEKFAKIINKFEDYEFYNFIHHHDDLDEYDELEENLDQKKRLILQDFFKYTKNSAGRLMQKNIIYVSMDWNIRQIRDYLRYVPSISSNVDRIFLIDKDRKIVGSISLARLLKSAPDIVAREIMNTQFTVIKCNSDKKKILQIFQKYSLSYILVADDDNSILGVITADDAMDVLEDQFDQNFMHAQYISGDPENIQNKNFISSINARVPWLLINIVFSMLVSSFVALFTDVIEKHIALAVLIPIIASISSISGAQTIATTIHTLAKEDVKAGNILRIFSHEIFVSISIALIMSILSGIVVYMRFNPHISLLYCVSMFLAFTIASLSGIFIPLFTYFVIKLDPAIVSPILVTTISDFSAYFFALMLAILLLN
jgi:magnesium transporter